MEIIKENNSPEATTFDEIEVGQLFVRAGNLAIKVSKESFVWLDCQGFESILISDWPSNTEVYIADGTLTYHLV